MHVTAHESPIDRPTVVVMAKPPVLGRVKTRLMQALSAEQATAVHAALLACVLDRLPSHLPGPGVLALAGLAEAGERGMRRQLAAWGVEPGDRWRWVDQGRGDLGARLGHVWEAIGGGAVAFFGADSPDVPGPALAAIGPALREHAVALGRSDDGGYWTLAARQWAPALLDGIDWGTPSVYHQSTVAAASAGLTCHTLPTWSDVDEPADLAALRDRLADADEPALGRLSVRLNEICTTSRELP